MIEDSEKQEAKLPELTTPFENIALSFSGGGFRAASFGLGVLSYLDHITFDDHTQDNKKTSLLNKITYMSSASGGSFTTSLYALRNVEGKSFEEYYKELYGIMQNDDLLDNTLKTLARDKDWQERPLKNRNFINAFAITYDKTMFKGALVKAITAGFHGQPTKTHLQEICLNSTEFYRGQQFRQQVKLQPDPLALYPFHVTYGNSAIHIDNNKSDDLKLGDLLAASSCFPAGFEPIIFPDDFAHGDKTASEQMRKDILANLTVTEQQADEGELEFLYTRNDLDTLYETLKTQNKSRTGADLKSIKKLNDNFKVGLMDGGITDNQGVESMMLAEKRRENGKTSFKPFDFMMVNDVGSQYMDPYKVPENKGASALDAFTLNKAYVVSLAAILLVFIWWLHPCWHCHFLFAKPLMVFTKIIASLGVLFMGLILFIRAKILGTGKGAFNLEKTFSDSIIKKLFTFANTSPFRVFVKMISTRLASVLILNNDVFLKRIRQLIYNAFFSTPGWELRQKSNHIYDLAFSNDLNLKNTQAKRGSKYHTTPPPAPGPRIQRIAETAYSMGTTLWFDKDDELKDKKEACIIACAQFTTCYNLITYIDRLQTSAEWSKFSPDYQKRVQNIMAQLQTDYQQFISEPFYLFNQLSQSFKMDIPAISYTDIPFPKNFEKLIYPKN